MALAVLLSCVGVLLAAGVASVAGVRWRTTTPAAYAIGLVASAVALAVAGAVLVGDPDAVATVRLPIGLPWLGAHFRLDCLSAFFLVVVNL
ncbi:MAG TPA: hydrogenase 4 subunit B, partial [Ramlibacter sp.]|nr:hydrogenase 4 subunit B [Ramlibacter sp.]